MRGRAARSRYGFLAVTGLVALLSCPPATADAPPWRFAIIPYLWGPGIDGTLGIGGRDVDVDASFSDLLELVDIAGSLRFEAVKGRWGGYGDLWLAELSSQTDVPVLGKIDTELDMSIAEAGAIHRVAEPLDVYLGLRSQRLDTEIRFQNLLAPRAKEVTITDVVAGARYTAMLGERWALRLRGDVGAGDSDLTWLAQLAGSYRFSRRWSGSIAYRHLQTDYDETGFSYDMALQGLGLGASYRWGAID